MIRCLASLALAAAASAQDLSFVGPLLFAGEGSPELAAARRKLGEAFPAGRPASRKAFARLAAAVRGCGDFAAGAGSTPLEVPVPGVRPFVVYFAVPESYAGKRPWPLVLAFGGGPVPKGPAGDRASDRQARMMRGVWQAAAAKKGWIVAAVRDDVSRSSPGIRYEVVRPRHLEAVLRAIHRRLDVDEDRTLMTGISLGSNYSLACGAAEPDLFCGAVPVATEGESREPLLRNLRDYPVYVLVGSRDRNIRTIDGPRALHAVLTRLGYDHEFEEHSGRGHEGFRERYEAVLDWFARRPRRLWAKEVVRVPHHGILAPARRFYWIGCDTRQATFTARVVKNTIDIRAASVTKLELFLSDELVDLDDPVVVRVNGRVVHDGRLARDPRLALRCARASLDRRKFPAARLEVAVPSSDVDLARDMQRLSPDRPRLAYWEHYALQHLEATRRQLGVDGETVQAGGGRVGLRVTHLAQDSAAGRSGVRTGDVVLTFDGNPFFDGDDPKDLLDLWCLREEYGGTGPVLGLGGGKTKRTVSVRLRPEAAGQKR